MTEVEIQEGSDTIDPSLVSVIASSPDDNNYKDQDEFSKSGYGERTLEEETSGDFEDMFSTMPSDIPDDSDF